jgi:hypothetical protein
VGYGKCEKGYRVYNLQTKKIVISRSVIFDEGALWNWEKHSVEHVTVPMNFGEQSNDDDADHEVTTSAASKSQLKLSLL